VGFVLRVLVNAGALMLAANLVPGVVLGGWKPALLAGLVLGLINAVIRPVLVILTFPITLLTLGLFLLVLNALCVAMTSWVVPGFDVRGFLPALLTSLVVSVVSWLLTAFISDRGRVERYR
jgi:putative membrane protein